MCRSPFPALAIGLALVASGDALAQRAAGVSASQEQDTRVAALEERVQAQQDSLQAVTETVTRRSGFISNAEARRRYEDAVFMALVGEKEQAALEFSILVNSGAVLSKTILTDAEWYLGETLFELGNYTLASETYREIIDQGSSHPFFAGSVRRLLEIHGITGDSERFYEIYRQYVQSGRVVANDLINYTVARSLFRQGDWARAKSILVDCCEEGKQYARARYILGTIMVLQGELEAAAEEFKLVSEVSVEDQETMEVVDLANLAHGRLMYELGDFRTATDSYLRVGRQSAYFADQLYELVWTFIKQEDYEQAIRSVEIFLFAYPEHRYTAELKVLRGHLHMKRERHENAHAAYEEVVFEYSPIRDKVAEVARSREAPQAFFERLAQEDSLRAMDKAGLPPFVTEMLYGRDDVARVVALRRSLESEKAQIEAASELARDIEVSFLGGLTSLGSFQKSFDTVQWLGADSVRLLGDLLALEEDFIHDASSSARRDVKRLREARLAAAGASTGELRGDSAARERRKIMEDQVRAVQSQAFLVEQLAKDLLTEAEATGSYLATGQHGLPESEVVKVERELDRIRAHLQEQIQGLRPLQTEVALRGIVGNPAQEDARREAGTQVLLADYQDLKGRLGQLRRQVTDPGARAFFSGLDDMWSVVMAQMEEADNLRGVLARVEQEEIVRLRQEFARQLTVLAEVEGITDRMGRDNDRLGIHATRRGFEELVDFFNDSVMKADMGIVDVYWLRRLAVAERIDDLNTERVELGQELDKQFQGIYSKVGD